MMRVKFELPYSEHVMRGKEKYRILQTIKPGKIHKKETKS